ncbi:MAG: carboxypeptidase-like regulatory protein [Bacteroidetes bacterium]|nr:carboxypeptidase-like regulatory protein [Bacteroidota bacterium]
MLCTNCLDIECKNNKEEPFSYNSDSVHCVFQLPPEEVSNKIVLPKRINFKSTKEALEIVDKVIKKKDEYQYYQQNYCNYEVYDKLMFAWNNFNPNKRIFRHWPFMKQYTDTSTVSNRSILPLAMYESFASNYYRRSPSAQIQTVRGRTIYGITDDLHAEDACENLVKIFETVDIRKNDLRLFFNKIIAPLNNKYATSVYRWEIMDTVDIQGKPYINLCFRPSSVMDLGFVGNLYVSTDGNFTIKRVVMKISKSMNINYVEEFVIYQNFEELVPRIWVPSRLSITTKISAFGIVKNYIEFGRFYNNFQFCKKPDSIYNSKKKIVYDNKYLERDTDFWKDKRTITSTKHNQEYSSDSIVNKISSIPFIKYSIKTIDLLANNYIPLAKKGEKNKISLGTFDTFYSANSIEGTRLRLTAVTTANLHPHLFFTAYGAYGFKDETFKYSAATTWAFNKPKLYTQEFPQNNLTFSCEYDLNVLGENYLYSKRDNIFLSFLRYRRLQRMTYARRMQLAYIKEFTDGFSFRLLLKTQKETPAGDLRFNTYGGFGNFYEVNDLQTTEISSILRFATNERFYVRNNERTNIPDERFVISLTHVLGLKNFLGGQYHYNRLQLHIIKDYWLASFGQLKTSFKIEKIWGTVPYPLLLAPNANNSYTIQNESFSLISPLEFINDRQMCWDLDYYFKGWLCKKIPYVKRLHLREVVGLSGAMGTLYIKNNPLYNHSLFLFPNNTRSMLNDPYLEMNMGLSNIFRVFRVDYIRRLNYLDGNGVKKDGLRVSMQLRF